MATAQCHHCKGTFRYDDTGEGHPWGWYTLSVNVPTTMGKNGKPYLWVGLWCCMEHLAADIPELEGQERLARLAYEAEEPEEP